MPIEKLRPSFTFTEDRLKELAAVVPEAFADGKINWITLQEALGEYLEDEEQEHFGLTWPGKREARRLAAMPSKGTLVPQPGEGINEDTTRNIFIEGDNLEVLKLLQKSYAGRVKMIYIDPPYNTGNDFVYPDDYSEPLEAYLQRTGQVDEAGQNLTTNTRASGRFHSNWLNMIYPRFLLTRQLLQDDGLIFVSIDDNEYHNLRQIMSEVFGEENFIGVFIWQSKKGGGSDSTTIVTDHEYVLCFSKNISATSLTRIQIEAEILDKVDQKGSYRQGRELNKWGSNSRREDRPTMFFPISGPNGEDVYPIRNDGAEGCWRWGKKKMYDVVSRGDVEFVQRDDGTYIVYEKIRTTDPRFKPYRTWITDVGTTADGSKVVRDLFDGSKVFDFAKPIDLLKHIILIGTPDQDGLVLDFFAGSASTAQAVIELNRLDNGARNFLMIQLPEETPIDSTARKVGYSTISELAKERIRKFIEKLQKEDQGKMDLGDEEDLGFDVFTLKRSNFKDWQPYTGSQPQQLETIFDHFETPLEAGWQPQNLLSEILLIQGFPLDSRIVSLEGIQGNTVQRVHAEGVAHELFVCLDENMSDETIPQLHLRPADILVCLDSALSDEAKIRLSDQCNLKVI